MAYPKKKSFKPLTAEERAEKEKEKTEKMSSFLQERGQQIIEALNDYDPTKMIWNNPIFNIRFTNPASGVRYNSENTMFLATQLKQRVNQEGEEVFPFFMTFRQAQDNGMNVKKGSKSYGIIKKFGKKIGEYKVHDTETNEEKTADVYKSSRSLDHVFHINDIEGEPSAKMKLNMDFGKTEATPQEIAVILNALIETSPVPIERKYLGEKRTCYYSPTTDKINMAPSSTFNSAIEEISTLAHEIGHAYGDDRRYKRECAALYHKDDKYRAEEELVANLTALAIINHFGLKATDEQKDEAFLKNHDAYDIGWATLLKSTPDAILRAAGAADKTAGKMIEEIEQVLIKQLKANPDLAVSDFIKERVENKATKLEAEENKPSAPRRKMA